MNVHNKVIEVRPGLMLGGLGGSQPTLFRAEGQNDFVNVFNPYPYTTEENFAKALDQLWKSKIEPSLEEGKQLILMTHEGPQDSATRNVNLKDTGIWFLKDGFYKFGSAALARLI